MACVSLLRGTSADYNECCLGLYGFCITTKLLSRFNMNLFLVSSNVSVQKTSLIIESSEV